MKLKMAKVQPLSDRRRSVLELIERIPFRFYPCVKHNFPNGPPSQALIQETRRVLKERLGTDPAENTGKTTNCGELPGWIARQLNWPALPDWDTRWGRICFTCPMISWSEYGRRLDGGTGRIWKLFRNNKKKLPRPGDFYIAESGFNSGVFAHIGVVIEIDPTGRKWVTADTGQMGGYAGCYREHLFNCQDGQFWSLPINQRLGGRNYLQGWIDVDRLFKSNDDWYDLWDGSE